MTALLTRLRRLEQIRRPAEKPDTLLADTIAALSAPRRAQAEALAEELQALLPPEVLQGRTLGHEIEMFSPRVAEVAAELLHVITWPPAPGALQVPPSPPVAAAVVGQDRRRA
jgi:hypothetical protein